MFFWLYIYILYTFIYIYLSLYIYICIHVCFVNVDAPVFWKFERSKFISFIQIKGRFTDGLCNASRNIPRQKARAVMYVGYRPPQLYPTCLNSFDVKEVMSLCQGRCIFRLRSPGQHWESTWVFISRPWNGLGCHWAATQVQKPENLAMRRVLMRHTFPWPLPSCQVFVDSNPPRAVFAVRCLQICAQCSQIILHQSYLCVAIGRSTK